MLQRVLLFSICTLILLSCSDNHVKKENIKRIFFERHDNTNPIDIIDVSYIKLETNDSCLISTTQQIETVDDLLLILDSGKDNRLLVFDINGNFITQIGRYGDGPGEYITLSTFSINKNKNMISLIDASKQKILHYSLKDFSFLSEKRVPFETSCVEYLSDGTLVWNNECYSFGDSLSDSYFVATDSLYNITNCYLKKEFKSGYITGATKMLYHVNDDLYAYTPFETTIYKLTDSVIPVYDFSFDFCSVPPVSFLEAEGKKNNGNFFTALENSNYISYYSIEESRQAICVIYIVNNERYIGFYDKIKDKTYNYRRIDFQEKLKIGRIDYIVTGKINDSFVANLSASILKEQKECGYSFSEPLNYLVGQSGIDDNPILLLFKMK